MLNPKTALELIAKGVENGLHIGDCGLFVTTKTLTTFSEKYQGASHPISGGNYSPTPEFAAEMLRQFFVVIKIAAASSSYSGSLAHRCAQILEVLGVPELRDLIPAHINQRDIDTFT